MYHCVGADLGRDRIAAVGLKDRSVCIATQVCFYEAVRLRVVLDPDLGFQSAARHEAVAIGRGD
jgi:hypothetical protein